MEAILGYMAAVGREKTGFSGHRRGDLPLEMERWVTELVADDN